MSQLATCCQERQQHAAKKIKAIYNGFVFGSATYFAFLQIHLILTDGTKTHVAMVYELIKVWNGVPEQVTVPENHLLLTVLWPCCTVSLS